jgi:hypothetical protein
MFGKPTNHGDGGWICPPAVVMARRGPASRVLVFAGILGRGCPRAQVHAACAGLAASQGYDGSRPIPTTSMLTHGAVEARRSSLGASRISQKIRQRNHRPAAAAIGMVMAGDASTLMGLGIGFADDPVGGGQAPSAPFSSRDDATRPGLLGCQPPYRGETGKPDGPGRCPSAGTRGADRVPARRLGWAPNGVRVAGEPGRRVPPPSRPRAPAWASPAAKAALSAWRRTGRKAVIALAIRGRKPVPAVVAARRSEGGETRGLTLGQAG